MCVMYYFMFSICFESLCAFFKPFPTTFICRFSSPCSSTLNNTLLTIYIYYQNVQGEPPRMVYQEDKSNSASEALPSWTLI